MAVSDVQLNAMAFLASASVKAYFLLPGCSPSSSTATVYSVVRSTDWLQAIRCPRDLCQRPSGIDRFCYRMVCGQAGSTSNKGNNSVPRISRLHRLIENLEAS